jgi:hypothetical protein
MLIQSVYIAEVSNHNDKQQQQSTATLVITKANKKVNKTVNLTKSLQKFTQDFGDR